MATPNYAEITATTLENRSGKLGDSVSANTALLMRLKEKGKMRLLSGGRVIVQELEHAENSTFQYYSGYETLNVSPSEVISAAEFAWKQASVAVSMSGLEQLQNSGKEQIIDLLEARIKNAEKTMINNISAGVYSDGTGSGSKQIGGLQLLVPDDPTTGTVGGINRATYSFWRSKKFGGVADGGGAVSSTNIQSFMTRLYVQLVRGTDKPDLIVADNTYWRLYNDSLQSIQRITNDKLGQAGFMNLKFMGADCVLDGGYGGDAPSAHMYFLNTDHIHFVTHRDRNFVPLGGKRESVNQDAFVKLIGWAGNMTLSVALTQGVLIA